MKLLRLKEMTELLGVGTTTLHNLQRDPASGFPQPIRIGTGPKAQRRWLESEVFAWIDSQQDASNDPVQQGSAA